MEVTVCDGICYYKFQTFTINDSRKVCDEACSVKFQAITMNGNAQVCDR